MSYHVVLLGGPFGGQEFMLDVEAIPDQLYLDPDGRVITFATEGEGVLYALARQASMLPLDAGAWPGGDGELVYRVVGS